MGTAHQPCLYITPTIRHLSPFKFNFASPLEILSRLWPACISCMNISSYYYRYDNKGCGRSYLSQRDLDAHIAYRHNKDKVTSSSSGITQITLPPTFFPSPVVSGTAVPVSTHLMIFPFVISSGSRIYRREF